MEAKKGKSKMAKKIDLEIETKTKTNATTRIALTFMLSTAIIVAGTFILAGFYIFVLNYWRADSDIIKSEDKPTVTNTNVSNTNLSNTNTEQSFITE